MPAHPSQDLRFDVLELWQRQARSRFSARKLPLGDSFERRRPHVKLLARHFGTNAIAHHEAQLPVAEEPIYRCWLKAQRTESLPFRGSASR